MEIKRLKRNEAIVVLIDFQEKLMPAMENPKTLEENLVKLVKGVKAMNLPTVVTQQYTKGLGATIEPIAKELGDFHSIDKSTFSAWRNEEFRRAIMTAGKKDIILTGIETHICLEQTALDMMENGYNLFIPADCVQSRQKKNSKTSLKRLAACGAVITSWESVLYELLESSKAPEFKTISAIVK